MPVEKICERCGGVFKTKPSDTGRKFCSRSCHAAHETEFGRPAAQVAPVEFCCRTCGKPFFMKPAYLSAHRKKHGKDPTYCSIPCSAIGRRENTEARSFFVCEECGKTSAMKRYEGTGRTVYYRQQRFCDQTCKAAHQRTAAAARFNRALADGGTLPRHQKRNGYWVVSVPSGVTGKKKMVFEHRFVMEQHLGRPLTADETVHHVNGNRSDNTLANLELFSSRHGPGQRVVDKVSFAIDMLRTYPEFAARAGVKLVEVESG